MIPRECDNDDCDYDTNTNGRLQWYHDPDCQPFRPDHTPSASRSTFLEHINLGGPVL